MDLSKDQKRMANPKKEKSFRDDSFSKSARTNNQSLMEKLFNNLRDLTEDGSFGDHLPEENSSASRENASSKRSSEKETVKILNPSRAFGQNLSLNRNLSSIISHGKASGDLDLEKSSHTNRAAQHLTARDEHQADSCFDNISHDANRKSLNEQVLHKGRKSGLHPAANHFKGQEFSKKSQSMFYNSGHDASLEQFTKLEEQAEHEASLYAPPEEDEEEGERDYCDERSQKERSREDSSEGDGDEQEDIKRLTIFGQQLPDSSYEGDEAEENLEDNRTIKELSERKEESEMIISSEDKRSLLKRLKENFENNNAFDCLEFKMENTDMQMSDNSLDIDDRRVLFESEVRKQIHRNGPFEETEEYHKLELLQKLSKNAMKNSPTSSTSKFPGLMMHLPTPAGNNKSIHLPSQSQMDISAISAVDNTFHKNPNNTIEESEESMLGSFVKQAKPASDDRLLGGKNRDFSNLFRNRDIDLEDFEEEESNFLKPKLDVSLKADNSDRLHPSTLKSSARKKKDANLKSHRPDKDEPSNGAFNSSFVKKFIQDEPSDLSQYPSRSLNKTTMRSLGDQQIEALKNMFFDSDRASELAAEREAQESRREPAQEKQAPVQPTKPQPRIARHSIMKQASIDDKDSYEPSFDQMVSNKNSQNHTIKAGDCLNQPQLSISIIRNDESRTNNNKSANEDSYCSAKQSSSQPRIPARGILSPKETDSDHNSHTIMDELTNYYLDQSHSRRMHSKDPVLSSIRIEKNREPAAKHHISELGDWAVKQSSARDFADSGFFSGDCPIQFPSNTNTMEEQRYLLENLTQVLKSDAKDSRKVVVLPADQVEKMQMIIERLEQENHVLRRAEAIRSTSKDTQNSSKKLSGKERSKALNSQVRLKDLEKEAVRRVQTFDFDQDFRERSTKPANKDQRVREVSGKPAKKPLNQQQPERLRSTSKPRQASRERERTPVLNKSIKTFKDLVEYIPTNSYSQIHAKKKTTKPLAAGGPLN